MSLWEDIDACCPIGLNADGQGPVTNEEQAVQVVCMVCNVPWPCPRSRGELSVTTQRFTFHVRYFPEDGAYVATVDEYPSMSWLDPHPLEALAGLIKIIEPKETPDAQ